jgi:hypothetical protein
MVLRAAVVFLASAFLGPNAAQAEQAQPPASFRESFKLEVPASAIADRTVVVWCARNRAVWRLANKTAGGDGYAFARTDTAASFYPAETCNRLEAWQSRSRLTSGLIGLDLLILIRESLYLGGAVDENAALCQAKARLAEIAIRFFGFEPHTQKIRKLLRLAYARESGLPDTCS